MTKNRGLYLHIPFCKARCGYCDFVTFTGKEDRINQYVDDLAREIELLTAQSTVPVPINTVFFGGGTPSLLEAKHTEKILRTVRKQFFMDPRIEITLEANPESITFEKAVGWRDSGVNRLSLGLQVYDDALLKKADRLHTVADFEKAYNAVRQAGFHNINIDLIYGLPDQSVEAWRTTLQRTLDLAPEHLSMYSLKVEDHTPFAAQGIQANDDAQAEMYEWARLYLKKMGYLQYEVSNFARAGYECQHNLIYWRQEDYWAAGVGAVGCVGGKRWENHKNFADYQRDIKEAKLPQANIEVLSDDTLRFERIMLGLRLREGFQWDEKDPEWLKRRDQLAAEKLLEKTNRGRWRVPDHAILFTHQVLLPFLG